MSMTRKDYQLIAEALKGFRGLDDYGFIVEAIADHLRPTNPRFDRQKFLTACGIDTVIGLRWQDGTVTIKTDKGIETVED